MNPCPVCQGGTSRDPADICFECVRRFVWYCVRDGGLEPHEGVLILVDCLPVEMRGEG